MNSDWKIMTMNTTVFVFLRNTQETLTGKSSSSPGNELPDISLEVNRHDAYGLFQELWDPERGTESSDVERSSL